MSFNYIRGKKTVPGVSAVLVAMKLPVQWCSFSGVIKIERLYLKWHSEFQRFTCWREGPHPSHNITLWECNFSFIFSHRFQLLSFCSWETLIVKTLLGNWKVSVACISSLIHYDLVTPFFFPFPPNLSWTPSINNIPKEPVRSSTVLESFMLSRCSVQCYQLLFQVPVLFDLAASNTDGTMQWESFVVRSCSWRQKILTG